MSEKDIFDEFLVLIGKLDYLSKIRPNNSEFWKKIKEDVKSILNKLTKDKRIYGW